MRLTGGLYNLPGRMRMAYRASLALDGIIYRSGLFLCLENGNHAEVSAVGLYFRNVIRLLASKQDELPMRGRPF
jgi:hypothetical protein